MAQTVTINGVSYPDVPAVDLNKTVGGVARFCDTSDANAIAEDILSGKTAYVNGVKLTGTGSGSVEPYAVVYAHYLEGATVICTDGSTTLTAQGGAEDWAFLLPNAGTWVVSATISGVTTAKSVVISQQYQCEYVNLGRVYLLRAGVKVFDSALKTAYRNSADASYLPVYQEPYGIVFTTPKSGAGDRAFSAQFQDMIDFGSSPNFSKLCAFFTNVTGVWGGYNSRQVGIADVLMSGYQTGIWTSTTNVSSTFFTSKAYDTGGSGATSVTLQLDVSGVTGQHYVGVMTTKLDSVCTDIWLE